MTPLYILIGCVLLVSLFIVWNQMSSRASTDPALKSDLDRKTQEVGELKNALEKEKAERAKKEGQGRQLYDSYKNLEADYKSAQKERDQLHDQVTKFETREEQRQKKHEDMVNKQENAVKALEDERQRIRRDDDERQQREKDNRDRLWKEHEDTVVGLLSALCKKPQHPFSFFDNTRLPEGFHGPRKPDFIIEFLGQYVIFDAKVSQAQNLQTFISTQVKETAKKYKGNEKIYSTIFLIIPTFAIPELKETYFYEESFHFHIISPEALSPILAGLKRIEQYEIAEAWDPQDREHVVDLIAQLDFHIRQRNAADFVLMQSGLQTLVKSSSIDKDMAKDIAIRMAKMRHLTFNTSEFKDLVANPALLQQQLMELTNPKPKIKKDDVDALLQ